MRFHARVLWRWNKLWLVWLVSLVSLSWLSSLVGCIELSPFESDLSDDERDQTERNLRALSASDAGVGDSFRFAVLSDSHQGYEELRDVVDLINARDDIAFVVHVGDMTYVGLRAEYRWTLERLKELDVPFFAAVGNHDLLSNGALVYREMFGPLDYSFEHGHIRFVLFNGNYLEVDNPDHDLVWLEQNTQPSNDIDGVIVLAHQLPSAAGYDAVLEDNHVLSQITGHYHGFVAERMGEVRAYQTGSAASREWMIATVDRGTLSVQACVASKCQELEP